MENDKQKVNANIQVGNYIRYIRQRIGYIKSGILYVEDDERKYLITLYKNIIEYGKKHILYFKYIFDSIDYARLQALMGIDERAIWRYLEHQREKLVRFIQQKELDIFNEYPYTEGTQKFLFARLCDDN